MLPGDLAKGVSMSTPLEDLVEQKTFLTPLEVSDLLRVSTQTVRRWIKEGKLPAYKVGRAWRIKEADLDEWLDGRRTVAPDSN
jgi:excisionase family DNA binding protein